MRRIGYFAGAFLILVGMFWSGRESSYGVGAFFEHWWCPIPLAAIPVGLAAALLIARLPSRTA